MRDLAPELKNRRILYENLLQYGFVKEEEDYIYKTRILNDKFEIIVLVRDGNMTSKVIDVENNCEYVLVHVLQATGQFVGQVKDAYEQCLQDIIQKCSIVHVFQKPQSIEVIEYIRNKYQDELEFLWEKFPGYAIWRNKSNRKWYGILMLLSKRKLGIDSDEETEVMNLIFSQEELPKIIDHNKVFPGYHMNKKTWITILLDGSIATNTIHSWIDSSYMLSLKK